LISQRKTVTELDRLEELRRAAVNCYSEALRSSERHVVELEASEAAHFRSQLQALRDQLRADADARQLESVQSSFEKELKDYWEKTRAQIQRLRKDVEAASAAMESFAGSVSESEILLEHGVKRELQHLSKSAAGNDIQEIRGAIHTATAKISAGVDQMRTSNQLAIAQLKDEIRLLHQEVQASRSAKAVPAQPVPAQPAPAQSGGRVDNRVVDGRIDELIRQNTPFSVLLVVVRNFEGLRNCYSANVLANAIGAFQVRFENILPAPALVGRWGQNQFAAILGTPPANAMEMSSEVVRKLSGPFIEQEQGAAHSIVFGPRAGVIEFRPGSDPVKFQAKLKQLADALAG
jgi:GGDEF domain-containing protein